MSRLRPRALHSTRLIVGLVAAGLVLVGCGGGSASSSSSTASPDASRSPNQDLRVAVGPDPFLQGNPPNLNMGLVSNGPNPGIFETLTNLTDQYGLQPGLAIRWESPSPQKWMFFLRPSVMFQNGEPFNAQAVVGTLETIAKRQTRPRGLDPGTSKVVANDEVEVDLTTPNGRLPEQLASPTMGIVAPGTVAGGGGSDPAMIPTGTGPFQFVSYQPGVNLMLKAFDRYWGPKPQLRTITFRFGAETDAGRLLATRQVDMAGLVPYEVLPSVSGRTDHFTASPAGRGEYLLLNNGGIDDYATLKDDNVRQAIALAIDRRAVQKTAWPDDGEDNATVIPSLVMEDTASMVKTPSQNVDQAKRLLDMAGWTMGSNGVRTRSGKPLNLSLILARPSEQQPAGKVLVNQLAAVGITLTVVDPTPDTPFVRLNNATFDLFMASQPQDDGNPCALCRFFSIRPGGQLSYAGSVGGGQMADDLYDQTYTAPTIDTARREAASIMNIVVAQKFTAIPLASLKTEWLISPRVRAFSPAALGGVQRWDTVWLTV